MSRLQHISLLQGLRSRRTLTEATAMAMELTVNLGHPMEIRIATLIGGIVTVQLVIQVSGLIVAVQVFGLLNFLIESLSS